MRGKRAGAGGGGGGGGGAVGVVVKGQGIDGAFVDELHGEVEDFGAVVGHGEDAGRGFAEGAEEGVDEEGGARAEEGFV